MFLLRSNYTFLMLQQSRPTPSAVTLAEMLRLRAAPLSERDMEDVVPCR